jgi:hypothetical protein
VDFRNWKWPTMKRLALILVQCYMVHYAIYLKNDQIDVHIYRVERVTASVC